MNPKTSTREIAFRIAIRFPNWAPSGKQVHEAFPELCRATAYRYARDYSVAFKARRAA
jgi:hypothetical protein